MIEENNYIRITECPRDAMQGIKKFIPTEQKVNYLNSLLKVGFDIIDFGSFVSPKAVPQMKDTSSLLNQLEINNSNSSLLSVVLNKRGACDAVKFDEIESEYVEEQLEDLYLRLNINNKDELVAKLAIADAAKGRNPSPTITTWSSVLTAEATSAWARGPSSPNSYISPKMAIFRPSRMSFRRSIAAFMLVGLAL